MNYLAAWLAIGLFLPSGQAAVVHTATEEAAAEIAQVRTRVAATGITGQKNLELKALRQLRDLQVQQGSIDSALDCSLRVVELSGLSTDRQGIADDWRQLVRVSREAGDLRGAIEASKRLLLVLKTMDDPVAQREANLEFLDLLLAAERYDEFRRQGEALAEAYTRTNDLQGLAQVRFRQGEALVAQGHPADAISLLSSALRHQELFEDDREVARVWFALAGAKVAIADWDAAVGAYAKGLGLWPNAPQARPELYGLRARIAENRGNLRDALQLERREKLALDSLLAAGRADLASRLHVLNEIRSHDRDLVTLRGERNAATERLLLMRNRLRWVLAGAILACVGFLVLLVLRIHEHHLIWRTKARRTLVSGRIREAESRRDELEERNLMLVQALMEAKTMDDGPAGEPASVHGGNHLLQLLVDTLRRQAGDPQQAAVLEEVRSRIAIMALVQHNLYRSGLPSPPNLQAHFTAVASTLLKEYAKEGKVRVDLQISQADEAVEDLLPLSLLLSELLRISLGHGREGSSPGTITVALHRMDSSHLEFLYTDPTGALQANGLDRESLCGAMARTWAAELGGTIRLLSGEATTLQYTFRPRAAAALRQAS